VTTAFVGAFAVYDTDRRSPKVVEEHLFICGFVAPCTFDDVVFVFACRLFRHSGQQKNTAHGYNINTSELTAESDTDKSN